MFQHHSPTDRGLAEGRPGCSGVCLRGLAPWCHHPLILTCSCAPCAAQRPRGGAAGGGGGAVRPHAAGADLGGARRPRGAHPHLRGARRAGAPPPGGANESPLLCARQLFFLSSMRKPLPVCYRTRQSPLRACRAGALAATPKLMVIQAIEEGFTPHSGWWLTPGTRAAAAEADAGRGRRRLRVGPGRCGGAAGRVRPAPPQGRPHGAALLRNSGCDGEHRQMVDDIHAQTPQYC